MKVLFTRFLLALWMASRASLMVTPLRYRAVIFMPREVTRSIRLTGGSVRCFVRISLSSTWEEDVLIFLDKEAMVSKCGVMGGQGEGWGHTQDRGLGTKPRRTGN